MPAIASLKQALSLHRRARALHKELQLAELALGKDFTEANLGRLKDIQTQLSALGGIEAAMEGFGAQSGRPGRMFVNGWSVRTAGQLNLGGDELGTMSSGVLILAGLKLAAGWGRSD